MYEKLELCPICKHTNFTNYLICTDHSVSGESFALTQCTKCSLVFTNPRPDQPSLPKYYQSEDYISHTNKANSLINLIYKLARKFTTRKKISLINRYSSKGKLLDFGCGTGYFLSSCKESGWKTYGLEPDDQARSIAEKNGIETIQEISSLKEEVDLITAWHVIEHVAELRKTIKRLKSKLKEGGYMFIALPNLNSYDARHYQEHWAGYDVPRHLYHFSQHAFGKLIAQSKLKLVEVLPMKLDAYYVSMLSEKYKNGKGNLFSSLKMGWKSNREAKKTKEYSSLIYVLKK